MHTYLLHSCLDAEHIWMASTRVQPSPMKTKKTSGLPLTQDQPLQDVGLGNQSLQNLSFTQLGLTVSLCAKSWGAEGGHRHRRQEASGNSYCGGTTGK